MFLLTRSRWPESATPLSFSQFHSWISLNRPGEPRKLIPPREINEVPEQNGVISRKIVQFNSSIELHNFCTFDADPGWSRDIDQDLAVDPHIRPGAAVERIRPRTAVERVVAGPAGQRVVQGVARDGVAQGPAGDVLDRVAGREGQGQPGVDHLRRRVAEVDAHGAGGGGREVERVDPAARLVDRVAAQGVVGVEAEGVVAGPAGQRVVAAASPSITLFRALPVRVSPRAPPVTFSIVLPAERVRVSPALTTCAAALPRLMVTARVVVAEKSSVSTPPPDSLIVSLPRALSVSKRKVSLPAPPVSVSLPPRPSITLFRRVAGEGVAQGPAGDVLDRVAGREGQGQPGVDHLRRRVAEVDGHGAGGGGREVERVDPAARLVDRVAAQGVVGVEAEGVVAGPAGQRVVAAEPLDHVVQAVAGEGVAQGPAGDVLDRVAGREGQGQPGVDHLRRRVAEVDAHGAGGGGREVERVDPAAGLVDRVAAQGVVGVEAEGVVAGPAGQRVVAAAPSIVSLPDRRQASCSGRCP